MRGLDVLGVLDRAPGELGEGHAVRRDALRLHLEAALLRHGRVPDVVRGEERRVERDVRRGGELVLGRVVRGHVDDRVDVGLESSGEGEEGKKGMDEERTKGTPAKFQKMTRKPHFSWNMSQVWGIHSSPFPQALRYNHVARHMKAMF